jgi:hypothetical protein
MSLSNSVFGAHQKQETQTPENSIAGGMQMD